MSAPGKGAFCRHGAVQPPLHFRCRQEKKYTGRHLVMPTRPEIFISATSKDLGSCRQLVRDALLTLGCVPVTQDHFAPDARTVREMLRARIAACDAVIHLAGECYGAEPFERAPAELRRSYTQMEYDMARELKKPVYTFICAPGFPYDTHEPEPDDLRARQEAHRAALQARDDLYQPIRSAQDLALHVRELQTRVEHLTRDLHQTRSWLGRGVAAVLAALALIGAGLFALHQHAQRTEARMVQVSDELDRYRQAIKAVADTYGKDIQPGRKLTDQEKFDRALAAVAEQQKISVGELNTWMAVFVAQVRANPGADFYDRALADFAQKRFDDAAADATKSAAQYHAQGEAAKQEKEAAGARAAEAAAKERRALTLVGSAELAAGHYAAALEPYRQALALTDKNQEPLGWCDAARDFEFALWRMGRYGEAEPLAREVAEKRAALQGPEHPDTLKSIYRLALVLVGKGDFAQAEALDRRCLEADGRILGEENPATLACVNNLAADLARKGDLVGAEALYRRCLEARERTLGKEHPDTLESINNLGNLLDSQGDYAGAEVLYRRSLEAHERTMGAEHPDTLKSIINLANVLDDKGDHAGAEALYRRALEAQERTLGREHPDTLLSVNNLAELLRDKGDYAGAEALERRCLEARERTLGKEYPATLHSVSNLAQCLDAENNFAAAEPLYLRALAGMEHVLPPGHPLRLDADYNFSLMRQKQNRLADALPLAEHAAAGAAQTLPAGSPDRLKYEKNLAALRVKLAAAPPAP
jgi:hypothetical protein